MPRPDTARGGIGDEAARRVEAWLLHERERCTVFAPGGQLEALEEVGGGRFEYAYDRRGDLARIVEANGRSATFEYDDARRLRRTVHPDGTSTDYAHEDDRLVRVDDRGVTRRFRYDAAGRLTRVRHGDAGSRIYSYDARGRIVEARTSIVSTAQRYHEDGRVAAIRQLYRGVAVEVRLEYDEAGRLAELWLPGSERPVRYSWDERGRPRAVALGDRQLARFEYLDEQRRSRTHLANGVVEETAADPVDRRPILRRVRKGDEPLFERAYTYDPQGRPAGDGVRSYAYDALDRLVRAEDSGKCRRWRYRYDARDNRVEADEPGGGRRYRYDADDRLVEVETAEGHLQIENDRFGRSARKDDPSGSWTYRFDDAGQLVEARHRGYRVARFTYDHKGRLAAMTSGARSERYLYGPDDQLVAVTDEEGNPLRLYVWTPLGLLAEIHGGADSGVVGFHHQDHQGVRHLVTYEDGRVGCRWEYDPFGLPSGPTSGPTHDFLPMFGNRVWCPEVGMYHFGARWYDPYLGRFLTPDAYTGRPDDERLVGRPAGSQGLARSQIMNDWLKRPRVRNGYAFCGNDPISRVDPNGHWSFGWTLLSVLGAIWTLPNTLVGLLLEITCLVGEVLRWLVWLVSFGNVSWETLGIDVAASGRLNAFALVFEGGWLGSLPNLWGITFGNVFFVHGGWDEDPYWSGTDLVYPPAYKGVVSLPRNESLYEHELRHTNQYGWFGPFFGGVYLFDWALHGYKNSWTERDAREHAEDAHSGTHTVPALEIVVQTQAPGGAAAPTPLSRAWVYWLQGQTITALRTNNAGRLLQATAGQDSTQPRAYTQPFTAPAGTSAQLFVGRGARRIPDAYLLANTDAFQSRAVNQPPAGASGTGQGAQPALITVVDAPVELTKPRELSIWPLIREPATDAYYTRGLAQGAALWQNQALTVTENGLAPAPAAADRPQERGLALEGTVGEGATGVTIQVLDVTGTPVQLRENTVLIGGVDRIAATLGTKIGNKKPFKATIHFVDPAAVFGPVQIAVRATGVTPPAVEIFSCHLAGLQIALVNDYLADPSGRVRGPVPTAADERIIVDFLTSPQPAPQPNLAANLAPIRAQTRARAMVSYQLAQRDRAFSATDATPVPKPEMPLWMAEFQVVGMNRPQLEDLMARRRDALAGNPADLRFDLRWNLTLSWDGPDSGTVSPRRYRYSQPFPDTLTATISLAADGRIAGVDAQGQVANALNPAPAAARFPVTGRRLPQVVVSGQTRRWGNDGASPLQDTLVIEWQPRLVSPGPPQVGNQNVSQWTGGEVMRGGDGALALESISIAGDPIVVDAGAVPSWPQVPWANVPVVELPRFRVRGLNPPPPHDALINALVADYFNRNSGAARIALLPLAVWQETIRRILSHEAGRQFEDLALGGHTAHTLRYEGQRYGLELDMPIFGPPHGYGYGQHDNPPVSDDGAWSFFENLRESVRRVMEDKATGAYNQIRAGGAPNPPQQNRRTQAVYRREIVRQYNGGREFRWIGGDWMINPTLAQWANANDHNEGANPRLTYPNNVLGTGVAYSVGAGAATQFPWPIAFPAAQYGPGI